MFPSKSFIVFALKFRFVISFELIFVCSVRKSSNFILFVCYCTVVMAPFVEKAVLSPLDYLDTLVGHQLTINVRVYFWTLNCSTDLYF